MVDIKLHGCCTVHVVIAVMQRVGEEEEESVGRWEDYEEVEEVE